MRTRQLAGTIAGTGDGIKNSALTAVGLADKRNAQAIFTTVNVAMNGDGLCQIGCMGVQNRNETETRWLFKSSKVP